MGEGLVQLLIRFKGEELLQRIARDQFVEQQESLAVMTAFKTFLASFLTKAFQLLFRQLVNQGARHLASVPQDTARMVHPLPNLAARNLRRRGVLHEIVDGNAAQPTEPGFDVLEADADVAAQPRFGDLTARDFEELFG